MSHMWILILTLTTALVKGSPVASDLDKTTNEVEEGAPSEYFSSLAKCSHEAGIPGLINCAATRTLKVIEQASSAESVELLPGVALVSENPQSQREGKSIGDEQLPDNPKQRAERLLNLILHAASRFFSGRTLKIKIPELAKINIARALEEGRGKMKKAMSPLLLALGAKAVLLKVLIIAGLGLMALKALVVGKIALIIAGVLAAQSLFNVGGLSFKTPYSGGGHGWITGGGSGYGPPYGSGPGSYNPGWTTNTLGGWGNSQYPYARSIHNVKDELDESKVAAQDLAYSKQKP